MKEKIRIDRTEARETPPPPSFTWALRPEFITTWPKLTKLKFLIHPSLVSFVIIPNIIFIILERFVYMIRPVFNVDYLLLGALAPYFPIRIFFCFYFLVLLNDLLVNIAPIFNFQIGEIFHYIHNVIYLDWKLTSAVALSLILFCALITAVAIALTRIQQPRYKLSQAVAFIFLTSAVSLADIANGTSFVSVPISRSLINLNLAYSGVRRTLLAIQSIKNSKNFVAQSIASDESATGYLFEEIKNHPDLFPRRSVVLIEVESLGLLKNSELQSKIFAPLSEKRIGEKYEILSGSIPFSGHTIDGEFRELCAVRLLEYGEDSFPRCLPQYLKERGFETVALHGFTKEFYNRHRWYPLMGFDRIIFAQEMKQIGYKKRCGSGFKGICDTEVVRLIEAELIRSRSKNPKFLHWMTLNSHIPLDSESAAESTFNCNSNSITQSEISVCLISKMIQLVCERIANLAMNPEIPPTDFILVGDHAPPFFEKTTRELYSESRVPYLILRSKVKKLNGKGSVRSSRATS